MTFKINFLKDPVPGIHSIFSSVEELFNYSVLKLCICIDIQIQLCIVFHRLSFELICPLQEALSAHCTSLSQHLMILPVNTLPGNTADKGGHVYKTTYSIFYFERFVDSSFCATRCSTKNGQAQLYVTEGCCTVRKGATSVSLIGHLSQPHLRATSDKQLITEPLAVLATLYGICRSDDISLSGIFFNWAEQNKMIEHFCCYIPRCEWICFPSKFLIQKSKSYGSF